MIYTVTLNPAIDKTVVIENLHPGGVNRILSSREDAGGKGINVSKCLKNLGQESMAAMILAGQTGKRLDAMLKEMKIHILPIHADGDNRTNLKIIDPVREENTDINETGPRIDMELLEQLKKKLGYSVAKGDIVVLSGSLPKGTPTELYADWAKYFGKLGACVYVDADGVPMQKALTAIPYMIKPNNEELAALLDKERLTREEMVTEGLHLHEMGIAEVVISLGGDGAIFISRDGVFQAEGLQVSVKSTVGAGDSMVAAMAFAQARNLSREETIRLAVAMGAASVMQSGSQPPEAELVWKLAKQVRLEKL